MWQPLEAYGRVPMPRSYAAGAVVAGVLYVHGGRRALNCFILHRASITLLSCSFVYADIIPALTLVAPLLPRRSPIAFTRRSAVQQQQQGPAAPTLLSSMYPMPLEARRQAAAHHHDHHGHAAAGAHGGSKPGSTALPSRAGSGPPSSAGSSAAATTSAVARGITSLPVKMSWKDGATPAGAAPPLQQPGAAPRSVRQTPREPRVPTPFLAVAAQPRVVLQW